MWKRSPDAAKAGSPELQAAFALLQRLWMKDYQQMWGALQVGSGRGRRASVWGGAGLGGSAASRAHPSPRPPPNHPSPPPASPQFAWGPQTQPLVAALAERLRGRQLDLVGRAYASISPAALAALLGCSEGDAVAGACDRGRGAICMGWSVAGGTRRLGWLTVAPLTCCLPGPAVQPPRPGAGRWWTGWWSRRRRPPPPRQKRRCSTACSGWQSM